MKKLLLILLCLPMIGFGQMPCGVEMIARLVSYSYDDYDVPYYSLEFNYQYVSSKNYFVYPDECEHFDIQPKDLKEGTYYFLNLSLSHSLNTNSIYHETINNIRYVTEDDKQNSDFEPFD